MTADQQELLAKAAEALLEGEEMSFSSHSAVIAAFGKHFANTGKAPVELHRHLIEAQEIRHAGDYGQTHSVTIKDADTVIMRAKKFLELSNRIVG